MSWKMLLYSSGSSTDASRYSRMPMTVQVSRMLTARRASAARRSRSLAALAWGDSSSKKFTIGASR